jgi:hypothetical protein
VDPGRRQPPANAARPLPLGGGGMEREANDHEREALSQPGRGKLGVP